jgi:hypothetical protein
MSVMSLFLREGFELMQVLPQEAYTLGIMMHECKVEFFSTGIQRNYILEHKISTLNTVYLISAGWGVQAFIILSLWRYINILLKAYIIGPAPPKASLQKRIHLKRRPSSYSREFRTVSLC